MPASIRREKLGFARWAACIVFLTCSLLNFLRPGASEAGVVLLLFSFLFLRRPRFHPNLFNKLLVFSIALTSVSVSIQALPPIASTSFAFDIIFDTLALLLVALPASAAGSIASGRDFDRLWPGLFASAFSTLSTFAGAWIFLADGDFQYLSLGLIQLPIAFITGATLGPISARFALKFSADLSDQRVKLSSLTAKRRDRRM